MSSWNQNNSNSTGYSPYTNWPSQRLPFYKADPIHGENAAWQFPIGGGEIYLPDADKDIIWWIRVDSNGSKSVTPFDVTPHQEPAPVDMNLILERLNLLEEKVNAKQNKSNAKRSIPTADIATTAIE